jgi:nucleotide-binding universal stress UspA family protein
MNNRTRILIAYDGSSQADAALDDLRRAGLPQEAEALVISVADVLIPSAPAYSYEAVEPALSEKFSAVVLMAREKALSALAESSRSALRTSKVIRPQFPFWNVRTESYNGSPAWELIRIAAGWKADLIVMGAPERSAFKGLILGSVSKKVVAEAHCSVRVARARSKGDGFPIKLVIGVDGSPEADATVRAVAAREWPAGTEAHLITALGSSMVPVWRLIQEYDQNERVWAHQRLDALATVLRGRGLNVTQTVKQGDPKRVLLGEAERLEADSIFVGASGLGRFQRLLLGSVSSAVAAQAKCSVEVIRTSY